jgi:hypothetical protein
MQQQPTLAGFQFFIANIMQIGANDLPPNSAVVAWALSFAIQIVNPALRGVSTCGPPIPGLPPVSVYVTAIYNLAASLVINFAQDQSGRKFFEKLRAKFNINGFVSGVIQSASDESTSQNMVVQEAAKKFTLSDLQRLKDPYGRMYLQIAQGYGPSTVGIS